MAGEPSLYLVYKDFTTDERNSDSWHGTQAAADAAAVDAGADFSANQGAVSVPNNWESGWIYNPTLDTWRTLDVSDLDELDRRKFAARVLFQALDEADDELASRRGIPAKVRGRVQDILGLCSMGRICRLFRYRHLDGSATNRVGRCDARRPLRCWGL